MSTFTELGLLPALVRALAGQGIEVPTPIQEAGVPVVLAGADAYLTAETGTGKTLAYLLPLFGRIEAALDATQVVIVAPTHELAIQIQKQSLDLAQPAGLPIRTVLLIGGTPLDRQIDKLKRKPQVVVGSPGRILDLIGMGKLKLQRLKAIVIDEADRQLVGEGLPVIEKIVAAAPATRQLLFVSATQEPACAPVLASMAPGLVVVEAGAAPVNPNIEHLYVLCAERDKADVLRRLLHALRPERAMVFVHRAVTAEILAGKLAGHHLPAADLHGAYHKRDRALAMAEFRSGAVPVLIVSDVGARGLDVKGVTHVFNVDVPTSSKAYLHRVGRTGRAGAPGQAVSVMTDGEVRLVRRYERELGITMQRVRLWEGRVLPVAADGPGDEGDR